MKKLISFASVSFLLISACQKDFNPGVPGDNLMVINSMFNNSGPMVLYLTTSYPASNANNNVTAISDAQISLYENNVFKEYLHYIPSDSQNIFGYYQSNLTPQNGYTYSIQAIEKNYPTASASDRIPLPVQPASGNLLQYPDTLEGNLIANLEFQDPPGAANYYRLEMYLSLTEYYLNQNNDTVYDSYLNTLIPYVISPLSDTARDPSHFLLFSDQGFSGQLKSLQIESQAYSLPAYIVSANLIVQLHTVSKSLYQYYSTLQIYKSVNNYTGIESYVYSDIVNGYGIFCSDSWKADTLKIR